MLATFCFLSSVISTTILSIPFLNSFTGFFGYSDRGGTLNVTVRDSATGSRVQAVLRTVPAFGSPVERGTGVTGTAAVSTNGRTDIYVEALGYKPLNSYFSLEGGPLDVTIYLDPIEIPASMRSEQLLADLGARESLFHGHIYDAGTGAPVVGAEVFIEGLAGRASTDEKGYFKLYVSTPAVDPNGDQPAQADFVVEHGGIERQRRLNTLITPGATHLVVDLKADAGEKIDSTHKMKLTPDEQANTQTVEAESPFSLGLPNEPELVVVPTSIRVGLGCEAGPNLCTTVSVFPIDTYVRNGLNDEWIASWNANSLKAGAIAYRSYGSYYVNHPRTANYDICSTTSCQVMDTDTHVNSDSATAQTVGTVVVNAAGTDFLRSEYSAENNLAPGCPDGNTGRPADGWPCLEDPVDAGQAFFGHGRGMCQWGTQRWSINQGKDFVWITNHYYNANGNPSGLRNGVLQMGPNTLLPPPELTEPGNQTAPGTVVSTFTPTFTWAPVAGATGYSLYVSRFNGSTYDIVFNSETALGQPITATSFTLPAGILVANGQYRWNMSSYIPAGYGTPNTFRNYFTVSPTVSLSGKVTNPSGIVIRNATVTITDSQGIRRNATTSSFGIYSFTGVAIGQQHTVTVATKRYRFTPQVLTVNGNLSNVDFVGLE